VPPSGLRYRSVEQNVLPLPTCDGGWLRVNGLVTIDRSLKGTLLDSGGTEFERGGKAPQRISGFSSLSLVTGLMAPGGPGGPHVLGTSRASPIQAAVDHAAPGDTVLVWS